MKKQICIALLATLLFSPSMRAIDYTVYGGMSMPRSNFADVASTGVNVGAKAFFPVTKHLSLIGSVDLFRNPSNGVALGTKYGMIPTSSEYSLSCTGNTSFTNVPVMGHLHFGVKPKDKDLRFWCEGAMGANVRIMSPERYSLSMPVGSSTTLEPGNYTIVSHFDNKLTFATLTSIGFTFHSRFSIGLIWYRLGRAPITGDIGVTNHTTGITEHRSFEYDRLKTRVRVMRFALSF
ncbi:MAG: hypothetical protein J5814_09635 [Bacteroidaceae bacterium]|nr:hypothetical protein [Bacteroidaceae bacterium]